MASVVAAVAAEREALAQAPVQERLPAGLSAREAQVLRLVAIGRSNGEIAEALFVSPNTVADHGSSMLGKTGKVLAKNAAKVAKGPKPFKYRDEAGRGWGGIGKRPQWLRNALTAGKSLKDFEVTEG